MMPATGPRSADGPLYAFDQKTAKLAGSVLLSDHELPNPLTLETKGSSIGFVRRRMQETFYSEFPRHER